MGKKAKSVTVPPLSKGNNSYAYINSEMANVLMFFSSVSTIDDKEVLLPHFEKRIQSFFSKISITTVVPTKSDSDVIFCLQMLSKTFLYTPLKLTRIDRSLVY